MVGYFNCGGQEAEDIPGGMMGETREDRELTRRLRRGQMSYMPFERSTNHFLWSEADVERSLKSTVGMHTNSLLFLFKDTDCTTQSMGA